MAMQVAVGHYDVRDGGQGVEVFVDQEGKRGLKAPLRRSRDLSTIM